MQNKYYAFVTIICVLLCQSVLAASPPMVERHIFTPVEESEKEVQLDPIKTVDPKALEKQVIFSGVIIGPKGKKALIRETGTREIGNKKNDISKNMSFSIGDQIKGMTIKEIGSNYLILAGQEGETKLQLYKGDKARPSAPALPPEPLPQPPQNPGMPTQPNQLEPPQSAPSPDAAATGPGPGGSIAMPAVPGPGTPSLNMGPGGDVSTSNPFADALRRAADRRANKTGQSPGNSPNPFTNMTQ